MYQMAMKYQNDMKYTKILHSKAQNTHTKNFGLLVCKYTIWQL
jgi:hypothetical protein